MRRWCGSGCLPGAKVTPDTILMDLSDPQLEQQVLNAKLQQQQAEADYKALQATLQSTLMDKKIAAAQVNADYTQDQLQAQTDKRLFELGVIAGFPYNKSQSTADQLKAQHKLSLQQLELNEKNDRGAVGVGAVEDRPGEDAGGSLSEADGGPRSEGGDCGRGRGVADADAGGHACDGGNAGGRSDSTG